MTSLRAALLIFLLFRPIPLLKAEVIYLGNGAQLQASAIATDLNGNVYVTGSTTDPAISWATNVFHLEAPGSGTNEPNVFVLKLNPSGEPVRLTYLGGSTWDTAYALAVDPNGSVCVVGQTTSSNFPVVNPLQAEHAPGVPWVTDGFVAKLNPSGSSLTFATYFGGNEEDVCTAVKIDSAGSVIVAGNTRSTNLWTANALQPTNASAGGTTGGYGGGPFSGNDAFVAKFHPSGTSLVYATYLGGMSEDTANSLALDNQGNAYIAGATTSTNFPTKNAFHGAYSTNESYSTDAFLAKLNATGQSLLFSTYLGGAGRDEINSVVVDHSGHAIVAGFTDSPDFPLTNAFPIFPATNGTGLRQIPHYSFVSKFSTSGSSLEFSTLVAEPNGDSARIALDQQNTLWFAGSQSSVAASSYGAYFGFVGSLNSNRVGLTATKLVECASTWTTDLAIAPDGVWALGAAYQQYSVDPLRIVIGRSFLVRLPGMPAATNANPLISLSRPFNGGFWGTNQAMPLQATAADFGGRISRVEFLADGQIVGTITNAPYELNWAAASLGIHTLQAIATDSLGARAISCPVNITAVVPPPNDQFEQCAPIFGAGVMVTGSIHGASRELGETSFGSRLSIGDIPARTLWWCWQAPSNGNYTISMEGTEFSETVNVYAGYGLNDLTLVASQRYGPAGTRPFVTFRATAGTIYFISVAGNNEVAGGVALHLRVANSPASDDFDNRILLSGLNATATNFNLEATTQPQASPGGVISLPSYSAGADVWWSWIAPISGVFSISTAGSSFPNQIRLYTGTNLSNLTAVPSAAWGSSSLTSYGKRLTFSAIAGTRYELSVDSEQTYVGDIQLQLAPVSSPANDHFANAQPIVGANATVTGTTFGATAEAGESSPSSSSAQRSVWWSWSPPLDGTYRITVTSSNSSNYSLKIFTGSTVSNLTLVGSGQTSYNPAAVVAVFKALASVNYRIAVDSLSSAGGDVQLAIQPVTPPANDDFANRIPLAGAPVVFSGTTANATRETGEPSLTWDSLAGSVWWTWTAPASSNYVLQLETPDYGPLVQVFRGTTSTNLTPASEILYSGYAEDYVRFNALVGETFQILVADNNPVAGNFVLSLGFALPSLFPPNDYFSNRIAVIGADIEIPANNVGASNEPGEPGANCSIGTTVWWTWTAPSNGPFTISTQTNGYGLNLSVYTGTNVSALTRRAGNTHGNVTFFADAATAYQIVVGECTMPGRDFTLRVHPAHPPINDSFSNRIDLTGSYVTATGDNRDATSEPNEPSISGQFGQPNQHTVWWSWTAPADGKTTVTASGLNPPWGLDAGVAVYTGSGLTALTRVNQSQWRSSSVVFQALADQTYHLQVDSGDVGDIALTINGPKTPQAAQFISAQLLNTGLQLEFIATPWRIHTLEYSPDLETWFEFTNTSAMLPHNLFWVTTSNGPARFFRLNSR